MIKTVDIAIIGGGMMGATLSLILAKALPNKSISIIDRRPLLTETGQESLLPSFDARSTALAPTTVDLMYSLGIWSNLLPHATAIKNVQVSDKGHCGWVRLTQKDNAGQPLGFVVDNRAMGRALAQSVDESSGIDSYGGVDVERLTPVKGGMKVLMSDGVQLQAELLVVADGADSELGRQLGIQQSITDYEQSAIVANVSFESPHMGTAYERFSGQGPMAILPLGGPQGRTSALVWTWPKHQVDKVMAMGDAQFLCELQKSFGHHLGRFTRVSSRVDYPLQLCLANEQVRSNLVMMGNAAHFLHPVAGQGFNLAARDGMRLAQALKSATGSLGCVRTLMAYTNAQERDQSRTISLSHGFNELFGSSHMAAIGLRNLGMLAIENCDFIRSAFIRQMSGRGSPKAFL